MDILLAFYLNYYSPRYSDTDRKMGISEKVMETIGQIIISCVKSEENFFNKLTNMKKVADQLLSCMEFQIVENLG